MMSYDEIREAGYSFLRDSIRMFSDRPASTVPMMLVYFGGQMIGSGYGIAAALNIAEAHYNKNKREVMRGCETQ